MSNRTAEQVLRCFPGVPADEVFFWLAKAAEARGDKDEANELLEFAVRAATERFVASLNGGTNA